MKTTQHTKGNDMGTTKRAKKGGEYGANGEWYEGGKFINTIPENDKKSGSRKRTARKVQVRPYTWEAGRDGEFPTFAVLGGQAVYVDRYAADEDLRIEPFGPGVASYGDEFRGYKVAELCEMWNNGVLWAAEKE
jgi:hypothetical protein